MASRYLRPSLDIPQIYLYRAPVDFRKQVNLERAVEHGKGTQDIGVHGKVEKIVVTSLVMRYFSTFSGAIRACDIFHVPTALFRVNGLAALVEHTARLTVRTMPLPIATTEPPSSVIADSYY